MELALDRDIFALCSSLFIIFVIDFHIHIHIAGWMGWDEGSLDMEWNGYGWIWM